MITKKEKLERERETCNIPLNISKIENKLRFNLCFSLEGVHLDILMLSAGLIYISQGRLELHVFKPKKNGKILSKVFDNMSFIRLALMILLSNRIPKELLYKRVITLGNSPLSKLYIEFLL